MGPVLNEAGKRGIQDVSCEGDRDWGFVDMLFVRKTVLTEKSVGLFAVWCQSHVLDAVALSAFLTAGSVEEIVLFLVVRGAILVLHLEKLYICVCVIKINRVIFLFILMPLQLIFFMDL